MVARDVSSDLLLSANNYRAGEGVVGQLPEVLRVALRPVNFNIL